MSVRAFDTSVCFVAAHLAAHRENVAGRNADVAALCGKLDFGDDAPRVLDHDAVFWLGDLNYRIRAAVATAEVFARADAGDLAFLLANDQLTVERAAGRVFEGFDEAPITFPVTYKYEPGSSRLERRPEKKLRAPAWCDRVLWRARSPGRVDARAYGSAAALLPSDHKPVYALLGARVLEVLPVRRAAVLDDVTRELDGAAAGTPAVALRVARGDGARAPLDDLDVGRVTFGERRRVAVVVENVGDCVASHRRRRSFFLSFGASRGGRVDAGSGTGASSAARPTRAESLWTRRRATARPRAGSS